MTDRLLEQADIDKRNLRAATFALLSCVGGLIAMRVIMYFIPFPTDTYGQSLAFDAVFSLVTQLVFFLAVPFCIFKFYGRRSVKDTLRFSSLGKFSPAFLLAIPLGFAVFIVTIGVSSMWTALLRFTGYTPVDTSDELPQKFVWGFFVAEVLLTAVLPAVCEEFAMRGGVLTTLKKSFGASAAVLMCAIIFGLFHQNIRQVFYTALFGGLAAFMTLKTKSIYPAMLMHFTNNFCSVYVNYADTYGWAVGGGFYTVLGNIPLWGLLLLFASAGALAVAMILLMLYARDKKLLEKRKKFLSECSTDEKGRIVVPEGSRQTVEELGLEREVYGDVPPVRPKLRDGAGMIALATVTVLTTLFTYVWGFFY